MKKKYLFFFFKDKKDTEPLLRKTVGSVASTIKAKDSMMKPIRGVLKENKNVMEASKMNVNIPEENIMKGDILRGIIF